ncbi:MAG: hypothetical protein QF578_07530 [Alphaproteobacteria bacterium]|nr:hypothetical protein [Alphaproteobacteria bacterium]MDP6564661.1 hypothetical protein [Alphaproteobacteria bacterium]
MTDGYKFDDREIDWALFAGFDDLWYRVLNVDHAAGTVDMLMKFAPGARCVLHNHVGPTRTLVIDGEHRVWHRNGPDPETPKIKRPGTFSAHDGDEIHDEEGGPDGAVILLLMTQVDGRVYDLLDETGEVERTITLADFQRGLDKQKARQAA